MVKLKVGCVIFKVIVIVLKINKGIFILDWKIMRVIKLLFLDVWNFFRGKVLEKYKVFLLLCCINMDIIIY